ncbi:MAG TPA: HlyD family secretion protein [Chthoniobacterales bacterium]|nr:HlyD family secretion protein [Chthoniobacterales bacterium]
MIARIFNYLVTIILVCLAAWAGWQLWERYTNYPWTRDSQVRANIVGIAPRVSGPIVRVAVIDNQQVKIGDLLFEIDPTDFTAELNVSSGQVLDAEANLKQRQQDLDRQAALFKNHVVAQQDFQNAQDNFSAAQAQLISAKANLELARLNLSYTKVFAPVNGYVTNFNTSVGTYVTAGKQLIAVVDTSSFWIAAYFKETQLPHIRVGQEADLNLMGYNRPFKGIIRSVGWGIYVQDGSGSDSTALLPSVSQTVDWVRLPQRFPVRIEPVGVPPVELRIGQTVSVSLTRAVEQAEHAPQP